MMIPVRRPRLPRYLRKGFIWLIILVLVSFELYSQTLSHRYYHASYISYPRFTAGDTSHIMKLIRAGTELQWSKPDAAMGFFEAARDTALLVGFYDGAAHALLHMAHTSLGKGDYVQSFAYYEKAEPFCRASLFDRSMTAVMYSDLATTWLHKGDYPQATRYYFEALKELKRQGLSESTRILVIYANLATVQTSLKQYDQAYYYLRQAELLARRKNYRDQLAFILNNMGDVYMELNEQAKAKQCYLEGLDMTGGASPQNLSRNLEVKQSIYNSLGALMLKQQQPKQAISYLKQSIGLSSNTNPYFSFIFPSYLLGEAYYQLKDYDRAQASLRPALKEAENLGFREHMYEAHATLAAVYEASGQYKLALDQQKASVLLKDSMMDLEKSNAVSQLEIKYRSAQKDRELTARKLMISRQQAELNRKNTWIWIVSLGILLLTVLLVLVWTLYRSMHQKQRLQAERLVNTEREKEMAVQEKELIKREEALRIMEAMIKGEENERSRLARELHDGIGGMLAAAQMHFSAMQHRKDGAMRSRNMAELTALLEDIADEVRKTSHNLMPDILLKHSFEEALRIYCDTVNTGGQLQLELQIHDDPRIPGGTVALSLYRILQELIQNIIRHASAKHAVIQLIRQEDRLRIMIEDDGRGFNTAAYEEGLGLQNLRTRVQLLQGYLSIESVKGMGTTVYVEFGVDKLKNILMHENTDSLSR